MAACTAVATDYSSVIREAERQINSIQFPSFAVPQTPSIELLSMNFMMLKASCASAVKIVRACAPIFAQTKAEDGGRLWTALQGMVASLPNGPALKPAVDAVMNEDNDAITECIQSDLQLYTDSLFSLRDELLHYSTEDFSKGACEDGGLCDQLVGESIVVNRKEYALTMTVMDNMQSVGATFADLLE